MANEIKTKKSFGSVQIDHFSPPLSDHVPKTINVHISFEEVMLSGFPGIGFYDFWSVQVAAHLPDRPIA